MTEIHSIELRKDGWRYIVGGRRMMNDTGEYEYVTAITERKIAGSSREFTAFDVFYDGDLFATVPADEVSEIRWKREYDE